MKTVRISSMSHARVARANIDLALPSNLQWMNKARCLRQGIEKFWIESSRPRPLEYEAILDKWCRPCPVRAQCLLTVIQRELQFRHTSRGVEGGCTPQERKALRRKIVDNKLCVTEAIWRYVHNHPLSSKPLRKKIEYTVTLSHYNGDEFSRHIAKTLHGAHIIARREQNKHPALKLIAVIKDPSGRITEVLFSNSQDQQQTNPSPEQ